LILFDAERAWSYAMELKRESRSEAEPRKRQHAIKRLRRASRIAEHLEHVCSQDAGKVDARTSLEAQV
jgi:signal recognition particle subunit SRP68